MTLPMRAAAAIAFLAIMGVGAWNLFGGGSGIGGRASAAPPTTTPVPTTAATPTSAVDATLDPSRFATYTSGQYGFTIGHPASWTERPATRAWSFDADSDATAPNSAGADHFTSSNGAVRVSAWTVTLDPGTPIDSREAVMAWVTDYCARTGTPGCGRIQDRAAPFCNESRDCHAAVLVSFDDWVGLFASGGNFTGRVLVVAVWRAENDPAVAPYGGARQLLETILSTMNIVPARGDQLDGWPTPSP